MAASAPVKTRKSAPGQTASIGPATSEVESTVRSQVAFAETAVVSPEDVEARRRRIAEAAYLHAASRSARSKEGGRPGVRGQTGAAAESGAAGVLAAPRRRLRGALLANAERGGRRPSGGRRAGWRAARDVSRGHVPALAGTAGVPSRCVCRRGAPVTPIRCAACERSRPTDQENESCKGCYCR